MGFMKGWNVTLAQWMGVHVDDDGNLQVNPGLLTLTDEISAASRDDLRNQWTQRATGAAAVATQAAGGVGTFHRVVGFLLNNAAVSATYVLAVGGVTILNGTMPVSASAVVSLPQPISGGDNEAAVFTVTGGDASTAVTLFGYTV